MKKTRELCHLCYVLRMMTQALEKLTTVLLGEYISYYFFLCVLMSGLLQGFFRIDVFIIIIHVLLEAIIYYPIDQK